jgi:hypothetical protein
MLLRTRGIQFSTALVISLDACVIDRPVADPSTERSRSAKVFAADCRAWIIEGRKVQAQAALIDFADGAGDLVVRWTVDGVALPSTRESRPRVINGEFVKYGFIRSISHEFPKVGSHEIAVAIVNDERSAACGMTISVPPE